MSIPTLLDTTKWTLLALYFFLEMWTFVRVIPLFFFWNEADIARL